MLSEAFNRSTAIRWNSFEYLLVSLPPAIPFPRKCALSLCLKLRVQCSSPQDPEFCAHHQVWYCSRKNEAMEGYSANSNESGQQDTPKMKMGGAKT
jgi:hypothetical protein